ncbi:MAG: elongation factor P hydroxylase [Gammaproteobacteria bacterium]|nr:elongation factor P hydroxylase [Gammaproteobacteria bacterium]
MPARWTKLSRKRGHVAEPSDIEIASCFNATFARSHHTVLVGGVLAPYYLPAAAPHRSIIRYRENFAASALHEAAHWCMAGQHRLRQRDFGYWYIPSPRSEEESAAFLAAECPVQALEQIFAEAAGLPFRVSLDDLGLELSSRRQEFAAEVQARARTWRDHGLPRRAQGFVHSLTGRFGGRSDLQAGEHDVDEAILRT